MLAIFLGAFGVHWFYLRKPFFGVLHAMFFWTTLSWIIAAIQGIKWLSMDEDRFDLKYNGGIREFDFHHSPKVKFRKNRYKKTYRHKAKPFAHLRKNKKMAKKHIKLGKAAFKDFDIEVARDEFVKALSLDNTNPEIYFELACCDSMLEQAAAAIEHLEQAVLNGYRDFLKIKTDPSLAYLRVQPEYYTFEANGFRPSNLTGRSDVKAQSNPHSNANLLDQLKNLQALKQNGLLTPKEFRKEKEKLLS